MSTIPVKFPRTPHLAWLCAGSPRDDKVLAPCDADLFYKKSVVIEEKIDGANIGIAVDSEGKLIAWNRGTLLGQKSHPQFAALWPWLAQRQNLLVNALGNNLILFGEWCFAKHSIHYTDLPDWFLVFDVYNREDKKFWSVSKRNELAKELGLSVVPQIIKTKIDSVSDADNWIKRSCFASCKAEGIYIRFEEGENLVQRAKLVNPNFTQQISEHWSSKPLVRNHLRNNAVS